MEVYLVLGERDGIKKTFLFNKEELQTKLMEGILKNWKLEVSLLNPFIYRPDLRW